MHTKVFVAGTFDGIHKGHESLLTRALEEGEKVAIGLTSDLFVKKFKIFNSQFSINEQSIKISNFKLKIRDYETRKYELMGWLTENNFIQRATIIPIDDPYEPAVSTIDLEALVVSTQTKARGDEINTLRKQRGLFPLKLIEVPMVSAKDGNPISSTRVRNGEIDQRGRLVMPQSMRVLLGKPLGDVLVGSDIDASIHRNSDAKIITVGDIATKTMLDAGITPTLAVIDGKVGRRPFHETLKTLQLQKVKPFRFNVVKSGPGFISKDAMLVVQKTLEGMGNQKGNLKVIIIDGEEDLLALPSILYAPIDSVVYYGQPQQGLVEIVVTREKKQEVIEILSKFS